MGTMITRYQSEDWAIFATEAEMVAHEQAMDQARVLAWIESVPDWPRGESARALRLVTKFLEYDRLM